MLVHLPLPSAVPLYAAMGLLEQTQTSHSQQHHHEEALEREASDIEDGYVNGKTQEGSPQDVALRKPLSVMLSNSLQRATGPLKGQLTIATQRMLVADAVSERPVLSWRGKLLGQ